MFVRLIIIIAVIYFCDCRRCRYNRPLWFLDHYSAEEADETEIIFESLVDIVSDLDEDLEKTCRLESITAVDKFDENGYSRSLFLAGFNPDKVKIKIKRRVMYTKVEPLYRGRKSLEDIKILPVYLNTTEAVYEIKSDKLYVNIPYLDDYLDFCRQKTDEDVIDVLPVNDSQNNIFIENENYDIDQRQGQFRFYSTKK